MTTAIEIRDHLLAVLQRDGEPDEPCFPGAVAWAVEYEGGLIIGSHEQLDGRCYLSVYDVSEVPDYDVAEVFGIPGLYCKPVQTFRFFVYWGADDPDRLLNAAWAANPEPASTAEPVEGDWVEVVMRL